MIRFQGMRLYAAALFAFALSSTAALADPSVDGVWTGFDPLSPGPSQRREHIAIYDRKADTYVMFGGFGFGSTAPEFNFNEVWTLSMEDHQWNLVSISGPAPGPRKSVQWGYDVARNRLLIFGGYGQHYAGNPIYWQNDVWELKLNGNPQWTELFPSGTPPQGRLAGVAVFDPKRQRFIGFGGTAGAPIDTWSLDLRGQGEWSMIDADGQHPNGAYGMGSIYDPLRDRMVVFGGSQGAAYYGSNNNIWELTLDDDPAWTQLYPADAGAPKPSPRRSMTAVYDPLRDRMIIYGGFDAVEGSDLFLGDTWSLSLSGPLAWTQLQPTGVVPHGRDCTAGIYDPTHDRMVIYGGWGGASMLGDTQFLTWNAPSTASVVAGSGSASMSAATLNWNVQEATSSHTAVFRKTVTGEWTSIATANADPSGTVNYVDTDVTPGTQYTYELVVSDQTGEAVDAGAVTVTTSTSVGVINHSGAEFALHPAWPNPAVRNFNVSFALPDDGPARLDIVDVAGRVVASRDVGGRGGPQNLSIGTGGFAPGMYFIRLTHANQMLTTRTAVMGR